MVCKDNSNGEKKNKALVPIMLVIAAFIVIGIGIFTAFRLFDFSKQTKNDGMANSTQVSDPVTKEENMDSNHLSDISVTEENTQAKEETKAAEDADIKPDTEEAISIDDTKEEPTYDTVYSYTELSDVESLDSDGRFHYYDYYFNEKAPIYTFQFQDMEATEGDFYKAVENYCQKLQTLYGFSYQKEFNENQDSKTGAYKEYLTRSNITIAVTANAEDSGYYVYVQIYILSNRADDNMVSFDNYETYIEGRDSKSYELNTEVDLDNGMSFYLYDTDVIDLGDGTAVLKAYFDLGAYTSEWYYYVNDFVVLPMASDGSILSDVCMADYVTDSNGNMVETPFLLDTGYYNNYTVFFTIPADTTNFIIYGTNISGDTFAGPVYYINIELD